MAFSGFLRAFHFLHPSRVSARPAFSLAPFLALTLIVGPLVLAPHDRAAVCVASWSTGEQELSIIAGARALFTYHIASEAGSDNPGFYSVMLYRKGAYHPIKQYVYYELFPASGLTKSVSIAPAEYGNAPGDYRIIIEAEDVSSVCRSDLVLLVEPAPSITGTVEPTRGRVPFEVRMTASPKDFPGGVDYVILSGGTGASMTSVGGQLTVTWLSFTSMIPFPRTK